MRLRGRRASMLALFALAWSAMMATSADTSARQTAARTPAAPTSTRAFLDQYCVTCHNQRLRTAGLALDALDLTAPARDAATWELVIGKLRAGSMPPPGRPRPEAAVYQRVAS